MVRRLGSLATDCKRVDARIFSLGRGFGGLAHGFEAAGAADQD